MWWLPWGAPRVCPCGDEEVWRRSDYLASCYLAGYPICPYIGEHKRYIENVVGLPVRVGTHPMPANYIEGHTKLGDWKRDGADAWLGDITGSREDAEKYDSTNPNFLKK